MTNSPPSSRKNAALRFFSRAYQVAAYLSLNTLILLVITIIATNTLLPSTVTLEERRRLNEGMMEPVGVNVIYSNIFNRAGYYLTPREEVEPMLAEYDLWAASGHWMVHPWTGITSRPFDGQYLNIGRDGERLGRLPDTSYEGKPHLLVWAFGGSTTFGWGLGDDYTIPSLLQTALQTRFPNHQVEVINFGTPIYTSSQELALFAANLRREAPDIAYFFDGLNDGYFTVYAGNPTSLVDPLSVTWENHLARITQPADQPWLTFNPSFPPLRLAQQLGLNAGSVTSSEVPYYAMQGTGVSGREAAIDLTVNHYLTNLKMIAAIGDRLEVATYFFLQPWTDTEVFPAMREAILAENDTENFNDLSTLFDTEEYADYVIYLDGLHYSDYASEVLAERMATIMTETYMSK